jgi:tRNA-binding EMAP/Myf-like protein
MAERIEAANKKIEDLQSLISEKTARLESLIMNGPELVSAAASRMGEIIESQGLKYIRAICEDLIARAKVLEAQAKKDLAKLLVEAIQTNKEETTTILKKIEEKRAGQSSKKAAAKKVAVVPIETGPASAEETKPAIETERRGAESLSEAEVIMKDFASFAARFGDGLAEAAKVGKKRLVDFIYDRFYSENPDQKLYDEGQPGFSALVEGYSGKMRRLKDYFYNRMIETERSEPLGIIKLPSPDFLYLKTHGGVSDFDRKEMGRLYFNSLPE